MAKPSATATGLTAGTYTVTVKDSKNCEITKTIEVIQPAILTATISSTDVNCNGEANGTATVTPTGGNGSYTYTWSNGQTAATATGLTAGTYTVTVKDSKNCEITKTIEVIQPTVLTATTSSTDVNCNGEANGTATVTPAGGNGSYTYTWSNGQTTSATATGLTAGTYTVTVKDSKNCEITKTIEVIQPTILTATISSTDVNCNGEANGTATVTPAGGNGSYTYTWSNGQTTATATGLTAGTYTVTVKDSKNCEITKTIEVIQPTILTATIKQHRCKLQWRSKRNSNSNTSRRQRKLYLYLEQWPNNAATATGLTAGTYTVTVKDSKNCEITKTIEVIQPTILSAAIKQHRRKLQWRSERNSNSNTNRW